MPFCIEGLRLYYVIPAHKELARLIRARYDAMDEKTGPPFDYISNNYGCFFSHTFPWLQFELSLSQRELERRGLNGSSQELEYCRNLNLTRMRIILVNDFMDCVTIHVEINRRNRLEDMMTPQCISYFLSLFVDDNNNFSSVIQRCIEIEYSIHFDENIIRYTKPYINILLSAHYQNEQRHEQLRQEAYAISGLREPVINISEYYFQHDITNFNDTTNTNNYNYHPSWLGPDNYVVPLIYELLVSPNSTYFNRMIHNETIQSNRQLTIRAWGRALTHNGIVISINNINCKLVEKFFAKNFFARYYNSYIRRICDSLGTLITNNLILISMERYIRRELQKLDKNTIISERIDQLGKLEEVLRAQYEFVTSTVGSVTGHGINKITIDGLNTISMSLSSRLMMRWQHINAQLLRSILLMGPRPKGRE